jgi:tetratricopeptide (TPR) repeat protein
MRDGVIVSRGTARATYQEIVDRRVDPGILELTPTGFVTRIFPIPEGRTKAVRIELAAFRPDGASPFPVPDGAGTTTQWLIRCHDSEPPGQSGKNLTWKMKDRVWTATGASSASDLAAVCLQATATTPAWAATKGSGVAWAVGRVPVADHEEVRRPPAKLQLWWDGSLAGRNRGLEATLGCLRKLMEQMGEGEGEVVLRVFREVASPAERFAVRAGACDALCERLRAEPAEGMARFDALAGDPGDGMILAVSEGISPLPNCRPRFDGGVGFDLLDPSGNGGGVLGSHVARAGCEVRAPSEGDWSVRHPVPAPWRDETAWVCRREGHHWIVAARTTVEVLEMLPGGVAHAPFASHAWAVERTRQMEVLQVARPIRCEFARSERVLGPETAFLVLDALDDYTRYGIEPPEPELRTRWLAARQKWQDGETGAANRLAEWTAAWRKEQDAREAPQPDYATRLAAAFDWTGARWNRLNQPSSEKITGADWAILLALEAKTQRLKAEADDAKARLRHLVAIGSEWERLVSQVNDRLGTKPVIVGGQVRRPGPLEVPQGATITEAIEAAGGATDFGSLRRVKVYRKGKLWQLDLSKEAYQSFPLDPDDVVEVPQKMILGDGGGVPSGAAGGEPTLTPQGLIATLRTPEAAGKPPELSALAGLLELGGDWKTAMRLTGQSCQWSGDFLRQVGALLENRGLNDDARRVAGSLAQVAPDDPACLRRAAETLGRTGDREAARLLLDRLRERDPDDPAPLLAIARLHRDGGEWPEAVRAYAAITERAWGRPQVAVWMCALTELNALLHCHGEQLAAGVVGVERIRPLAADLRLVAEHDLQPPFFGFEIACLEPLGNRTYHRTGFPLERWENSAAGALIDVTIREAVPGTYTFRVFQPGPGQGRGPLVTVEADLFINFGRANETKRRVFLRCDRYGYSDLARASWKLAEG